MESKLGMVQMGIISAKYLSTAPTSAEHRARLKRKRAFKPAEDNL